MVDHQDAIFLEQCIQLAHLLIKPFEGVDPFQIGDAVGLDPVRSALQNGHAENQIERPVLFQCGAIRGHEGDAPIHLKAATVREAPRVDFGTDKVGMGKILAQGDDLLAGRAPKGQNANFWPIVEPVTAGGEKLGIAVFPGERGGLVQLVRTEPAQNGDRAILAIRRELVTGSR